MTGLLICAAVAMAGYVLTLLGCAKRYRRDGLPLVLCGLALIAVALWLAYAAGGAA